MSEGSQKKTAVMRIERSSMERLREFKEKYNYRTYGEAIEKLIEKVEKAEAAEVLIRQLEKILQRHRREILEEIIMERVPVYNAINEGELEGFKFKPDGEVTGLARVVKISQSGVQTVETRGRCE